MRWAFLTNPFGTDQLKDVNERLRFHINISNKIIEVGLFSFIAATKLDLEGYLGDLGLATIPRLVTASFWQSVGRLIAEKNLVVLLAIFTALWYFRYSKVVRSEMDIVTNTFSRFNPPHDWEKVVGRKIIPFLAVGMTLTFLALAWTIDNIQAYCVIVILLNVMDIRGNTIIRQNLIRHFRDPRFLPLESDLHKEFIMRRREVAQRYWVERPQIERIGLMMIAVMAAFMMASSSFTVAGIPPEKWFSYPVVMLAIAANEMTMTFWRLERDPVLARIDVDEAEANRLRLGS